MNSRLYTRLAVTNMKNNRKFYIPYLITGIITVAMFYIIVALQGNEGLSSLPGAENVKMLLGLGIGVIGICAVIFLFYTNSFIIKRRKKELGVYNILGMEKRHLAKVLFWETFYTALAAIVAGLGAGLLFNKLMCMFLYRLMGYNAGIDFYVSMPGITMSVTLFLVIYALTYIYDLLQVRLANPIELLHGGNVGEREPKTKLIMTVIGFICIGVGYGIAITVKSPLQALMLFFVAVVLVIVGTYCLFTAGSIALLKLLRKNKKYYYNAKHFTAVSGMLYRMKQNAVGLSNICILSTMVLVVLSTTFSMYLGIDDELATRYPYDITIEASYGENGIVATDEIEAQVEQALSESGRRMVNRQAYESLNMIAIFDGESFALESNYDTAYTADVTMMTVITREGFAEIFDQELPELLDHEIVLASVDGTEYEQIKCNQETFDVVDNVHYESEENTYMTNLFYQTYYVVVNDTTQLSLFYGIQKEANRTYAGSYKYSLGFDVDGTEEERIALDKSISNKVYSIAEFQEGYGNGIVCECRQANSEDFHRMYGGFFFLGIYLGIMFLMITVLIIFYKQISEGYDDKERFAIMEKVGMSNREVKASISAQVRIVFFLPLLVAGIHVAAAFPMISRLLMAMNLMNVSLFRWCVLGTMVVFAIIYLIVFLITSRTYYRIVGRQL